MNWATGALGGTGHVDNAVSLTNEVVTSKAALAALLSGGGSLIAKIQMSPIAVSSFKKIADDDESWKLYCKKLSEVNTFVTCGFGTGALLRAQLKKLKERENGTSVGV